MNEPKYIFFTGGVVSSVGKGVTAAALGLLLKERGFKVGVQKLDPYINGLRRARSGCCIRLPAREPGP